MKIHHIGIVAKDVPETLAALGLSPDAVMESVFDPVQENTLHFVYLADNDLWLEIVQPMSDASSTASFARRSGADCITLALPVMALTRPRLCTRIVSARLSWVSTRSAFVPSGETSGRFSLP